MRLVLLALTVTAAELPPRDGAALATALWPSGGDSFAAMASTAALTAHAPSSPQQRRAWSGLRRRLESDGGELKVMTIGGSMAAGSQCLHGKL